MSDAIKKLVHHAAKQRPAAAPKRGNVTYYLRVEQADRFKRWCENRGQKPSEMIDALMEIFLREADELAKSDKTAG